jgi:hypothetical protein
METQALKFMANQPGGRPLRSSLDLENPQQFEAARGKFLPAAYVIRKQGLAALRKFQDLIVDRGGKHKAKALSTLLLGQQKIPLIDGNYGNPGQLKRSVRTLCFGKRGEKLISHWDWGRNLQRPLGSSRPDPGESGFSQMAR